jgi:Tol biopolymer transport system component
VANTATSETYQLTSGKKSSTSPKWSPDSCYLAFISGRDSKRQVYLISPTGGEAKQITNGENGVTAVEWRPSASIGLSLAYTSTGPDPKTQKDRKEKYGDFQIIDGDYRMVQLWLLNLPEDIPSNLKKLKPQALTTGDQFSVGSLAWSPEGTRIAFSATRYPYLGSQDTEQIYVVDASDLRVKKLLDAAGPNTDPRWSPDGKKIAYVTSDGQSNFFYANRFIAIVPSDGGAPELLTGKFDEDPNLIDWGCIGSA